MRNLWTRIGIVFAMLVLVAIIAITIFILQLDDPYFHRFADVSEVESFVESILPVQQATLEDVQTFARSDEYGYVDCYDSAINDHTLVCYAQQEKLSYWFYTMMLYFDGNLLQDVEVFLQYKGL